jgi:hypothetical protein
VWESIPQGDLNRFERIVLNEMNQNESLLFTNNVKSGNHSSKKEPKSKNKSNTPPRTSFLSTFPSNSHLRTDTVWKYIYFNKTRIENIGWMIPKGSTFET